MTLKKEEDTAYWDNQIARCISEQEKEKDTITRQMWSEAITVYEHMKVCKLRHSQDFNLVGLDRKGVEMCRELRMGGRMAWAKEQIRNIRRAGGE